MLLTQTKSAKAQENAAATPRSPSPTTLPTDLKEGKLAFPGDGLGVGDEAELVDAAGLAVVALDGDHEAWASDELEEVGEALVAESLVPLADRDQPLDASVAAADHPVAR